MSLTLLLAACTEAGPPPPRDPAHPDVIVITLDTLRADHLSQNGYDFATSDALDDFVDGATAFPHAVSTAPWTLPSTTAILTGLAPAHHKVVHSGDVLPAEVDTLAERLTRGGYRTGAISYNVNIAPRAGLDQGFGSFDQGAGKILDYPHISKMVDAAKLWLDDRTTAPFFLYLQPMNCHGPYKVPESHRSDLLGRPPKPDFAYYAHPMDQIMFKGRPELRSEVSMAFLDSLHEKYDTAIRYSMDQVAVLLAELKKRDLYDESLIILTADHGEELFDHGGFSHGYSLYDELLHVPLYVKLPHQARGHRVDARVSTLNLTPTILDVVGLPHEGVDGTSLRPILDGGGTSDPQAFAEVNWPKRCVGRSMFDGNWKLTEIDSNYEGLHDVVRLYNLADDPDEHRDLAAAEPARVATMLTTLHQRVQAWAEGSTWTPQNVLDKMDKDRLEALGYLE